jgi:hypothetical protein
MVERALPPMLGGIIPRAARRSPVLLLGALLAAAASAHAQPDAPDQRAADQRAPRERAEAFIGGAALERFVRKATPVALEIPGDRASATPAFTLTLIEARYCGTTARGEGRVLGVVKAGSPTPAPVAAGAAAPAPAAMGGAAPLDTAAPRLAGENDCRAKLGELAERAAGTEAGHEPLAVIEILVTWIPSRLRVTIGEIAAGGQGAALGQALARARAAGPVRTIETAAVGLSNGHGVIEKLSLALAFQPGKKTNGERDGGVAIAAVPAARPPPEREARTVASSGAPLDAGSDARLSATYALANRLLSLFDQDGPLVLQQDGQSIELRGLQLSGGEGFLTARGEATSRELQETLHLTIDATGDDLQIAQVRAEPVLERCAGLSLFAALGCQARNAARAAAASAAANALSTRYRGERLRTLGAPPEMQTELDRLRFGVRLTPLKIQSTADAIVIGGQVEIERR